MTGRRCGPSPSCAGLGPARASTRPFPPALATLLRTDLAFVSRHWREPCLDLWEEESSLHYFTLRVQAAALEEGADWSNAAGDPRLATGLRDEAKEILLLLDTFQTEDLGSYRSRLPATGGVSPRTADVAAIIATNHAEGRGARHSVRDRERPSHPGAAGGGLRGGVRRQPFSTGRPRPGPGPLSRRHVPGRESLVRDDVGRRRM